MKFTWIGVALLMLTSCKWAPSATPTPIAPEALSVADTPVPTATSASSSWTAVTEPARYYRLPAPLIPRAQSDQTAFLDDGIGLQSGEYRVEYDGQQFLINSPTGNAALSLTLPGGDALNLLVADPDTVMQETIVEQGDIAQHSLGKQIILTGQSEWTDFQAVLYTYNFHPGLLRWRLEIMRHGNPPASPQPELHFVDRTTGEETAALLETYADKAPMAAPHLFAYSEALDSTLFYWVDLTALNPFMEAAHYTPSATPRRMGQQLGHSFSRSDLSRQPEGVVTAVYDSYLYLTPGQPADEDAMFGLYLHNLGDIYDLIAIPDDPLPAWFDVAHWDGQGAPDGIHRGTIRDLADEQNWVTLEDKRYLRAYVADTRQSAEAISQLDVYSALARYQLRFGETPAYFDELRATIPDFFNPDFGPAGMFQNSGPLTVTGPQGRGDAWYELGHALKVAELALWYPDDAELLDLAIRSGDSWIDFAHAADYRFPKFYSFETWQGTGQQPDTGGGFAYFMLLLHELTGEEQYVGEARNALQALDGYGFRLSYETHMTAITAAAAARLYQLEPDSLYLDIINRAVANLMRLSWIWESDYGFLKENEDVTPGTSEWWQGTVRQRTFFGLNPTQQSAAITAKEQYEAWIYLLETLQRVHGELDPTVEKLISEFVKHTLLTIPRSLPVFLPPESVTVHPAAYETVSENDLSLMIPLEDLRDGWDISGVIGQEVYGAGMAPAMAALALVEIVPGITVYSGYPPVSVEGEMVTFAGTAGSYTPVIVIGANAILDAAGNPVDTETCGAARCFIAEGGSSYRLRQ
jgi:hypothetical protein